MHRLMKLILFCFAITLSACQSHQPIISPPVIDANRIAKINVKCHTFNNSVKTIQLQVLDVTANSVRRAFNALWRRNFPIYAASCYENRLIVNDSSRPSLHAYGAAIDINWHINPYYNVIKGGSSIIPERYVNRASDEKKIIEELSKNKKFTKDELDATMSTIIQENGSDDWFINREFSRKGMLTKKEAEIFANNGFTIWGGMWRQPMDFMHFQIPRKLAEILTATNKEKSTVIWNNYLLINKWHFRLKKKVDAISKKKGEPIWQDHLAKCQFEKDYLAAANKTQTTAICVRDCKRKCRYIDSILLKRAKSENKCPYCSKLLK